jgi:mevalonate kinase
MFPMMWNASFDELLAPIKDQILGYKISGAGGGGYLVVISEHDIVGAERIKIKRSRMI